MEATQYLTRRLQSEHSPAEAQELLALIPTDEVALVQSTLNNMHYSQARRFADDIISKAEKSHVPHEVCKKRHFLFSFPVIHLALHLHRKVGIHPVVGKYSVATTIVFVGAWMATNPINGVPHFIWDGIAYTIHGMGAAPIVESMLRKLQRKQENESR